MPDSTIPPPILGDPTPPPPLGPEGYFEPPHGPQGTWKKAWAGVLAFIAATWKFILPVLKFAPAYKVLLTAGTMLLSVWAYALLFGWKFAVGFVICIFIHEMGHVFAAYLLGVPVSAPIFIPLMGAMILNKRSGGSAWNKALIGIGGPAFGCLAALGCFGLYMATGNPLFLGLALTTFLMNLFNMIPMLPLDGGWITGAVSPYIWVAGMVALLAMVVTGELRNPMVYIIIFMSLPSLVNAFRRGTMDDPGTRTTPVQKVTMGLAYVGLAGILAFGVAVSAFSRAEVEQPPVVPSRGSGGSTVALRFPDHILDKGEAFHHAGKADRGEGLKRGMA